MKLGDKPIIPKVPERREKPLGIGKQDDQSINTAAFLSSLRKVLGAEFRKFTNAINLTKKEMAARGGLERKDVEEFLSEVKKISVAGKSEQVIKVDTKRLEDIVSSLLAKQTPPDLRGDFLSLIDEMSDDPARYLNVRLTDGFKFIEEFQKAATTVFQSMPTGLAQESTLSAIRASLASLSVSVSSIPVRSRTADSISVAHQTDAVMNGLTALTPKFAVIAAGSSGDNTVLSGVSSKKIRIIALNLILSAATNLYFKDSNGTVIWGGSTNTANFAANGGMVLPFNPVGWFETGSGYGLTLNLSAANKAAGSLTYVEV